MCDQQGIFARISNSKLFSKMGLAKGFFQIPLEKQSRLQTAIATPKELYHFKVLSFGLPNSPAVFNRVMHQVLHGFKGVEAFVDYVLVDSTTFEEHHATLQAVLQRLQDYNMSVKPSKCELFQ